jgi:hypothetical protein
MGSGDFIDFAEYTKDMTAAQKKTLMTAQDLTSEDTTFNKVFGVAHPERAHRSYTYPSTAAYASAAERLLEFYWY